MANNLLNYYSRDNKETQQSSNKKILLLKDFDEEILSTESIQSLYSEIFDELNKTNYNLFIKKHPNDCDSNFNTLLIKYPFIKKIESNKGAETIIAQLKPDYLMSGLSTSIFSSPSIFSHTPAISYMKMYLKFKDLNPLYKQRINYLHKLFNHSEKITFIEGVRDIYNSIN